MSRRNRKKSDSDSDCEDKKEEKEASSGGAIHFVKIINRHPKEIDRTFIPTADEQGEPLKVKDSILVLFSKHNIKRDPEKPELTMVLKSRNNHSEVKRFDRNQLVDHYIADLASTEFTYIDFE